MNTGCGKFYVTVNQDAEGNVFELFTSMGKAGGCASSQSEALGRMISLSLRSGIEKEAIVKQLKGISCHQPMLWGNGGKVLSCADAVAKALENYAPLAGQVSVQPAEATEKRGNGNGGNGNGKNGNGRNGNGRKSSVGEETLMVGACVECGGTVEHEGGCAVCHNCGFTKCN
jgi:ribonucleoside-diphosphate reductase alpha chain